MQFYRINFRGSTDYSVIKLLRFVEWGKICKNTKFHKSIFLNKVFSFVVKFYIKLSSFLFFFCLGIHRTNRETEERSVSFS